MDKKQPSLALLAGEHDGRVITFTWRSRKNKHNHIEERWSCCGTPPENQRCVRVVGWKHKGHLLGSGSNAGGGGPKEVNIGGYPLLMAPSTWSCCSRASTDRGCTPVDADAAAEVLAHCGEHIMFTWRGAKDTHEEKRWSCCGEPLHQRCSRTVGWRHSGQLSTYSSNKVSVIPGIGGHNWMGVKIPATWSCCGAPTETRGCKEFEDDGFTEAELLPLFGGPASRPTTAGGSRLHVLGRPVSLELAERKKLLEARAASASLKKRQQEEEQARRRREQADQRAKIAADAKQQMASCKALLEQLTAFSQSLGGAESGSAAEPSAADPEALYGSLQVAGKQVEAMARQFVALLEQVERLRGGAAVQKKPALFSPEGYRLLPDLHLHFRDSEEEQAEEEPEDEASESGIEFGEDIGALVSYTGREWQQSPAARQPTPSLDRKDLHFPPLPAASKPAARESASSKGPRDWASAAAAEHKKPAVSSPAASARGKPAATSASPGRVQRASVFDDSPGDLRALNPEDTRKRGPAVKRGKQQGEFRAKLEQRYDGKCVVTGCAIPQTLEAAHILNYQGKDSHDVNNGLLLRRDIHALFDAGILRLVPVEDNLEVRVEFRFGGDKVLLERLQEAGYLQYDYVPLAMPWPHTLTYLKKKNGGQPARVAE